jgi:hypothetical protein
MPDRSRRLIGASVCFRKYQRSPLCNAIASGSRPCENDEWETLRCPLTEGVIAREKFALQHRYLVTLHTDQGHPHVHVAVRTMSEQGQRLNIRKATPREWRPDFAKFLRDIGVQANATERAVLEQKLSLSLRTGTVPTMGCCVE